MRVKQRPVTATRARVNQSCAEHAADAEKNPADAARERGSSQNRAQPERGYNQECDAHRQVRQNCTKIRNVRRRPGEHICRRHNQNHKQGMADSPHVGFGRIRQRRN